MVATPCFTKALAALAVLAIAEVASAQAYPDHPIRIVIPYSPGGGTDILLRMIAPEASAALGQSIVIDNRPGGSTIIGTGFVSRAAADGYTLLATDSAILINPGLFKKQLTYDTLTSLTGITMLATSPALLVINPKLPVSDLDGLIALAKSRPGALNFASGGVGSAAHLSGELFKLAAGLDLTHVPYKGTNPALTAVLSGEVDMAFLGISSARQYVASGALRAIALTGKTRNPSLPDVPTFLESNLEIEGNTYWGIYAPAGLPPQTVDRLNKAFNAAILNPSKQRELAQLGYTPIGNSPQEHSAQLRLMVERWTAIVDKSHIATN